MKYDVRIFPNGRVVMLPDDMITEATKNGQEILIVCNSWAGGYAMGLGTNKKFDDDGNMRYVHYTYPIKNQIIEGEDVYKYSKIIFDEGECICMETGDEAIEYVDGKFVDWLTPDEAIQSWVDYFGKKPTLTEEELVTKRFTIDEMATVRNILNNIEDKVNALIEKKILTEKAREYII